MTDFQHDDPKFAPKEREDSLSYYSNTWDSIFLTENLLKFCKDYQIIIFPYQQYAEYKKLSEYLSPNVRREGHWVEGIHHPYLLVTRQHIKTILNIPDKNACTLLLRTSPKISWSLSKRPQIWSAICTWVDMLLSLRLNRWNLCSSSINAILKGRNYLFFWLYWVAYILQEKLLCPFPKPFWWFASDTESEAKTIFFARRTKNSEYLELSSKKISMDCYKSSSTR